MRQRQRSRGRHKVGALAAALLVIGACGGGDSGSGATGGGDDHDGHDDHHGADSAAAFGPEEATSTAKVTLVDYAFVGVPPSMKGPNVLIEASVRGSNEHEIELLDAAGAPVGAVHPFRAGTKQLAVVLQPGTYNMVCLVKEGARTHADLGMRAQLVVE